MFDKLKKILGFGAPDLDENVISEDTITNHPTASPFLEENNSNFHADVSIEDTTAEIFEHVVARFNTALPDFLQRSIDPEKEKKALYDALSDDIKAHLKGLENKVNDRLSESWRSEREKLQADLKAASKSAKDIETKRNELKSQQLSAERQKRAMTERIHELEKQLLASEAEREQIELENKSMLNKVKVAGVYEKEMEEMRQLIESLQEDLKAAKQNTSAEKSDSTEDINESSHLHVDPNPELLEQIKILEQEREKNRKRIEDLSKVEKEHKELVGKMSIIEDQISKFESFVKTKDDKIEELKAQISKSSKANSSAQAEVEKLKAELSELKKQNEKLKEDAASKVEHTGNTTQNNPSDIKPETITLPDVDDILTDTEWVVQSSTQRINKSQPRNEKNKNKKPTRDDGQMSLW